MRVGINKHLNIDRPIIDDPRNKQSKLYIIGASNKNPLELKEDSVFLWM